MICPFEGYAVHELEEVDGVVYFTSARTKEDSCEHTPMSSVPQERKDVWDYYSAKCWKLPGKIEPYMGSHGEQIDPAVPETVFGWIRNVATEILKVLDEYIYFKDERYPAIVLNFILNTYLKDAFDFAPRVLLTGGTDCGKSRLMEIVDELCYHSAYMVRPTFAVTFRLIDAYGVTPVIDEAQRLKKEARADLDDIFLSGIKKNGKINRCNSNSLKPETFNIYSPMMVSTKTGMFTAEDIDNRSFTINMLPNRTKKLAARMDRERLRGIRTELYSVRALYDLRPECFALDTMIDETIHELTDTDENGNMIIDSLVNERIRLKNRSLDIAITYYTLAKLTGTEHDILSLLNEEDRYNSERLRDTSEGEVFRAYVQCCNEKADLNHKSGYLDIMTSVTSREIKDLVNSNRQASGNLIMREHEISGRKVCDIMKDIGLEMARSTKHNNNSIVKRVGSLEEYIDINESRYATQLESGMLDRLRRRGTGPELTSKLIEREKLSAS